jgi:hypothetical protein
LVGRHFQAQVSFTLQKTVDDYSKFEPVFSLLPVDLYAMLLPLYGPFNRHTIKLALELQCSKGVNQSPPQFQLVVQVRASSPSPTAAAPDSITSTPTSVPNGSANVTGSTIGEPITGNSSDDRLQTCSLVVVPENDTAVPRVINGSSEKLCPKSIGRAMSSTDLVSLPPQKKISNLFSLTAKSREQSCTDLVQYLSPAAAKSLETNCTRHDEHLRVHVEVAGMGRDSKRIKTGQAPVTNSTNTVINRVDVGNDSWQRVKKERRGGLGAIARRKESRERKNAFKPAAHLNGSAQTATSLNGSNDFQQDERSQESSRARVPCDEHHARKEADEQARLRVEDQARKEAEEQARKEADEQARKEAEEQVRKVAEEQAKLEAEEQARKEADEQARTQGG